MTLREFIRASLHCDADIDRPMRIRLVRRDEDGVSRSYRFVPIARLFDGHTLQVEMVDYDESPEERM